MNELQQVFDITYVNTYEDELLTESSGVEFVPTIIIENELGEHKMVGNNEIAKFLHEIISPSKTNWKSYSWASSWGKWFPLLRW